MWKLLEDRFWMLPEAQEKVWYLMKKGFRARWSYLGIDWRVKVFYVI